MRFPGAIFLCAVVVLWCIGNKEENLNNIYFQFFFLFVIVVVEVKKIAVLERFFYKLNGFHIAKIHDFHIDN